MSFLKPYVNKIAMRNFSSSGKSILISIVGSGPAGFYCSQGLLKNLPNALIDIYDKLPVPFGLVRYGVAPDHGEVKNVINQFSKLASDSRIRFVGNVTLGKDIFLRDLRNAYDIVVLSYGADEDLKLNIPGENFGNVISARQFVGWYNGLPNEKTLPIDLNANTVSIIGQGNVAVDVARILLKSVDELKSTDITEYSLGKLAESRIKRVFLIGRRGPLQVAFTIKELRELVKLPKVQPVVDVQQMQDVADILPSLPRPRKRLTELLLKIPTEFENKPNCDKHLNILFLRSPLEILGKGDAKSVQLGINRLVSSADEAVESQKAVLTNESESLPCEMVFRSIGYRSVRVDPDIHFKSKSCVGSTIVSPGVYSTGWLSTGPTGVILSTMSNAFDTANQILNDVKEGTIKLEGSRPGYTYIKELLKQKGVVVVDWNGWKRIDEVEIHRGRERNKSREKITDIEEMLEIGGNSNY